MALTAADSTCKLTGPVAACSRLGGAGGPGSLAMQPAEPGFSTDGLPRAFLQSLRTLFDILDDDRRGYVHVSEIESRWQGADTRELPGGVLECLRRVAPPHGCLTFERFVAGLRFSLLSPDADSLRPQPGAQQPPPKLQPGHPLSQPSCRGADNAPPPPPGKVRPLAPSNGVNTQPGRPRHPKDPHGVYPPTCAPPKDLPGYPASAAAAPGGPARYGKGAHEKTGRSLERIPVLPESGPYRPETGRASKQQLHQQQNRVRSIESLALESPQLQKGSAEGGVLPRSQSETATGLAGARRHGRSRDEQRRHTITSGVDYGMLKQMKELEQEKDSLLAGLELLERARDWYQQQIHSVTERQRLVGQSAHSTEFLAESGQSRLGVLLPRLQEVTRCLGELLSCPAGPFSLSPSTLAPSGSSNPQHGPPNLPHPQQAVQRLKDQNRLLTKEVTEKSERITQLEQEKSALIKQLFEARARGSQEGGALDSTFI